jgi:PDZ domain-containing protein
VRPWRTNGIRPFADQTREGLSVALFTVADQQPRRNRRGRLIGWIILVVAILGIVAVGIAPAPYLVEEPGPAYNTLGAVEYKSVPRPLISISGKQTYPTGGSLDMLTVTVSGDPQQPPSWAEIAGAWLDPSKAVVPIDELYAPQETVQQSNAQSAAEMADSQQDATAAALHEQGIAFETKISVLGVQKNLPADGKLEKDDVIDTVDGQSFIDSESLHNAVVANGTNKPLTIVVTRKGVKQTVQLTPAKSPADGSPAVGVYLGVSYTFPFKVNIQLQNVGGPSAGMMFALGIIDKLTPGKLNGGQKVAGTGTINASGTVGAIGGIRQKLYGARAAGAKYFLAPKSNCNEVVGHIPAGITVFSTSTLKQSVSELTAIASGKGLSSLPVCTK